jgi:hypothetical protein
MIIEKNSAIIMASYTQIEKSYTCDSSYYTYNKLTNRISSSEQQQLYSLDLNNIKHGYKFDGVNSTLREILERDGLTNSVLRLAH